VNGPGLTEREARIAPSAAAIGASAWNGLSNPGGVADPHPFTRYEFFAALEESGSACAKTGWQPCHLVLEEKGTIKALMPLYLKNHSQGEYVFDHAWADALERAGGDYYPKLQCAVPFTPVTGPRLLGPAEHISRLLETAKAVTRQVKASSLHITFPTETEWQAAGDAGFLLRTDRQFHWANDGYRDFEDFLSRLSSAKRKNLRKERASVREAGVEFEHLTGSAITEAHWDRFFDFYIDTGSRKWGNPYLTRNFFSRIGASMADQILLVMAKRDGDYIAGALNLFGNGTLYGRNWGTVESLPFLHFETCYYQAIDFAIARGLNKVEAGAQGTHKLLRGYLPEETRSAHYIVHPDLAQAVDAYLARERDAIREDMDELAAQSPFKKE
jgi:predicted N-acyltransferase